MNIIQSTWANSRTQVAVMFKINVIHQENEKTSRDWEKVPTKDTSDKGLLMKIYNEPLKLKPRKRTTQFKIWAKDLKRHLTKKHTWIANKQMKRC